MRIEDADDHRARGDRERRDGEPLENRATPTARRRVALADDGVELFLDFGIDGHGMAGVPPFSSLFDDYCGPSNPEIRACTTSPAHAPSAYASWRKVSPPDTRVTTISFRRGNEPPGSVCPRGLGGSMVMLTLKSAGSWPSSRRARSSTRRSRSSIGACDVIVCAVPRAGLSPARPDILGWCGDS